MPEYQFETKKFLKFFTKRVPPKKQKDYDSKSHLKCLGIKIIYTKDEYYVVELTSDWVIEQSGYTTLYRKDDKLLFSVFEKTLSYDYEIHVNFFTSGKT